MITKAVSTQAVKRLGTCIVGFSAEIMLSGMMAKLVKICFVEKQFSDMSKSTHKPSMYLNLSYEVINVLFNANVISDQWIVMENSKGHGKYWKVMEKSRIMS